MNTEHFRAFNAGFFAKHQRKLLWLLNSRLSRRWFRWVMRIRPHDARLSERIVEIQPNNYKVFLGQEGGYVTIRADVRTHRKYSKRLYYSFRYVWWAMHFWDWLVADRLAPQLSFGFSTLKEDFTLTVNPDSNPETTTVDGRVRESQPSGVSWATLVGGSGTTPADSASTEDVVRIRAKTSTDLWDLLDRSIYLFDTSFIGAGKTITSAVMSVYGQNKTDPAGWTPDTDVYTSNPASNTSLGASDFTTLGSTSQTGSAKTYANWSTSAYNDYTFNSTGRTNVSLSGISKFGIRNASYDVAASSPTWSSGGDSETIGYMADQVGTSNDPKLVVTYTYPAVLQF